MSAFTEETQIANLALAEIGAARITNLDADTSAQATACRLHFNHIRNSLLRLHPWSFAEKTVDLSASATAPVSSVEWDTAWTVPGNLVRLIRLPGADRDIPVNRFRLAGKQILTNGLTSCRITYVANDVPVTDWDDLFVDAFRYKLASEIAPDLAQSPQYAEASLSKFKSLALPDAQTADAQETASGENHTPRQQLARSGLIQSRYGATLGLGGRSLTTADIDQSTASDLDAIAEEGLP